MLNRDRVDLLMTSAFCCWRRALFIRPIFAGLLYSLLRCLAASACLLQCAVFASSSLLRAVFASSSLAAVCSVQLALADQRTATRSNAL